METEIAFFMFGLAVGMIILHLAYLHDQRITRREKAQEAERLIAAKEEERVREYFQR